MYIVRACNVDNNLSSFYFSSMNCIHFDVIPKENFFKKVHLATVSINKYKSSYTHMYIQTYMYVYKFIICNLTNDIRLLTALV